MLANLESLFTVLEKPEEGWNTVKHLLDIFKAGFYSKHPDVALWTCKLLTQFALELNGKGLSGPAWDWFISGTTGGLQGVLYCATKTHSVPTESAITVLCQFGKYNYAELFTHYLKQVFPNLKDYMLIVSTFINPLAEYKPSKDELISAGILQYWIDLGCQKADTDPNSNKPEERAAALGLLLEIWLNFPSVVEEKAEYADTIIKLAQRANRDKNECIQIFSLGMLFRLLDVFAVEKNPYAPIVYKTLTFALVENHQKTSVREFILNNFKQVFEQFGSIPPSIVIEPFVKQIRRSEGITFFYNLFDFDFFVAVAKHPKLVTKNAVQVLDLLAKAYLYDDMFSTSAIEPFITISYRFKDDQSFVSFVTKLLKFALGVYSTNVKKVNRTNELKSAKYLKYINAKIDDDKFPLSLQNNRVLELVSHVLGLNNDEISEKMLSLLLEENARLKPILKQDDEGLVNLLQKLGNPLDLLKEFTLNQKSFEASPISHVSKKITEKSGIGSPKRSKGAVADRRIKKKEPRPSANNTQIIDNPAGDSNDRSVISERETIKGHDSVKKIPYPKEYSLVPYKKLTVLEEKAIREIERIKQKKDERLERKKIEENRKRIEEIKKRRVLKKQLDIRKIEQGLAPTAHSIQFEPESLIQLKEGEYEKTIGHKKVLPEIQLFQIDEEEQKDIDALSLLIEERKKLFRYLFNNYSNSGHTSKRYSSFDILGSKSDTISISEIAKMFKDHNVPMKMLSYLEISTFVRLINASHVQKTDLTFSGFLEFFKQAAVYIYSKGPNSLSYLPPATLVTKLLDHFKQAAKARNERTPLYDNPYATSLADQDVLNQLTRMAEENEDFQPPEGYKKVMDKRLLDQYELREGLDIPEGVKIAVELLDEIVGAAIDSHIIEPLTAEYYVPRVVPVVTRPKMRDIASNRYLQQMTREPRGLSLENSLMYDTSSKSHKSQSSKIRSMSKLRGSLDEMSSKLTPSMKLAIACAGREEKEHTREVAEVIGEIIEAVERGRPYIKQGKYVALVNNRVLKEKREKELELQMLRRINEDKRKQRHEMLKRLVEEGKVAKELKKQEEIKKQEKEKEAKKRKELREKEKWEEMKRKLMDEKTKKHEEEKNLVEQNQQKTEEEKMKKLAELKALKAKKKRQYLAHLKLIKEAHNREKQIEEEKKASEKRKAEIARKKALEHLAKDKELRENAKKQKELLADFVKRADILSILAKYRRPLQHVFKYFARQDNISLDESLSQALSSINFAKFSKLCSAFKLVPELMSTEDMVYIFRQSTNGKGGAGDSPRKEKLGDSQTVNYDEFTELLVKVGLMLVPKLQGEQRLNKQFDTTNTDGTVLENLLNYMEIKEEDNKQSIDKKMIAKMAEAKSVKRFLKKETANAEASPKGAEDLQIVQDPSKELGNMNENN